MSAPKPQCHDCGGEFASQRGVNAHRGARGQCQPVKTAMLIEIRGLYDGWSVRVLENGVLVNRWAGIPGWERLAAATDEWIREHAAAVERGRDQ